MTEHLFCKEWLRELGLPILDKTRLQGEFIAMFQGLKGAFKDNVDSLSNRAGSNRTEGNSVTLKRGKFRLDGRKKLFISKVVELWHRLPKKWLDAPA